MTELELRQTSRKLARACALALLAIAALVLLGWAKDITSLKQLNPSWNTMKVNTALAFVFASVALLLLTTEKPAASRRDVYYGVVRGLGAAVLAIGALTLLENWLTIDLGIDELLFRDSSGLHAMSPGRMSARTALMLVFTGGVFICFDVPSKRARQFVEWSSLLIFAAAVVGALSYLYGVSAAWHYQTTAAHSVIGFLLISVGVRAARPERGITSLITEDTPGGTFARRLLPVALILVPLFGVLRLWGQRFGLWDSEFGSALFTVTCVATFVIVIIRQAVAVRQHDDLRRNAERALAVKSSELEVRVVERTAELSRVEAILRRSEVELRAVIDQLPDGVFIRRREQIIYANRAFVKMLGYYRSEDLIGKSVFEIVPAEDHEVVKSRMAQVGLGTMPAGVEMRFLKRTNDLVLVEIASPQAIQFEGGPAVLLAARDINERRRAEAERTLLREVAVASSEAPSFEAAVKRALDLACAYIGWPVGHAYFVERDPFGEQFLHSTGVWHVPSETAYAAFREVSENTRFGSGDGVVGRVSLTRKAMWVEDLENEPLFIRSRGQKLSDFGLRACCALPVTVGGDTMAVVEFFRAEPTPVDKSQLQLLEQVVTQLGRTAERQRADSELRLSEERFRTLASASPVGIIEFDAKGDPIYANEAMRRYLGTGSDLRSAISSAIHRDDYESFRREWLLRVHETGQFARDFRFLVDGEAHWVHTRATPIYAEDGRCSGWVATIEDIHARILAQEELERAREMAEAASLSKSEFLANMSHEIRTPMNAIIGMADLLSESDLQPEQRKYVETSKNAGEHLLGIINDILDLSKVEAGQLELEHIDFDLVDLTEKTLDLLAVRAAAKNVELACHIAADVPTRVIGDPHRLRQVLVNLISNAIKFTEVGEVVLRVKRDSGDKLAFAVSDTGIGIPADKIERVFESFTQADASTTREHGGTGLGLSISRKLVTLMGGAISATSEVGRGSTFTFTSALPESQTGETPQRKAPEHFGGRRALVVDDNATNRLIMREMLSSWGVQVEEAASGEEALALVTTVQPSTAFDLILLDRRMPGISGFDVAEKVRAVFGPLSTTMMMLTSELHPGDLKRCHELGVTTHLVKPIKRAELREAIGRALGDAPDEVVKTRANPASLPLRLLLVDDAADNRLLVESYLKDTGCELDSADNGKEAVQKFQSGSYDLVLMDMQMPVEDGYSATRRIRAFERETGREPTPIIALTANALKADVRRSLAAGATSHLSKPIRKKTLLDEMRRLHAGAPAVSGRRRKVRVDAELKEIVPGFLANRKTDLTVLEAALEVEDFERIAGLGHTLKGIGGGYGFDRVTEIGDALERAAKAKKGATVRDQIDALRSFLDGVEVVYV